MYLVKNILLSILKMIKKIFNKNINFNKKYYNKISFK